MPVTTKPSVQLTLARAKAIFTVHAAQVTDEIMAELDDWSEIGWVMLECGCLVCGEQTDGCPLLPPGTVGVQDFA